MNWISIEDRLPEDYSVNLVYGRLKTHSGVSIYQAQIVNKKWNTIVFEKVPIDVKFWQPLPEPPKETK